MANLARNGPRPRRGRFMGSGSHSFASHTRATSLAPGGSHSNVISKVSLTLRLFLVIIHPSVFAASQLCTPVLPGGYKGRQASGSIATYQRSPRGAALVARDLTIHSQALVER